MAQRGWRMAMLGVAQRGWRMAMLGVAQRGWRVAMLGVAQRGWRVAPWIQAARAGLRAPGSGAGGRGPKAEDVVRVEMSPEAEEFVRRQGGRVWVWVARPLVCCWGTPAFMHAATEPPPGMSGFSPVSSAGLDVWFRIPGGRVPDVLEIVLRGKRHPRVEAYWDGCIYAL